MNLYYYDDVEIEVVDNVYLVRVYATAVYTYTAGRLYMDNGDPGYPPEDDLKIAVINAVWLDENDNTVQPTKEMTTALEKYLNEMDFSRWNEFEPEDY